MKEYKVIYKVNESVEVESEIVEAECIEEAKELFLDWVVEQSAQNSDMEDDVRDENSVTIILANEEAQTYLITDIKELS